MHPTDQNLDFVRQFLYGPSAIVPVGDHATADILMDDRMEGWIGIPHGGIGMGIMMDLMMRLDGYPQEEHLRFPLSAEFRFAGTSIRIGDLLHFDVTPVSGGAEGSAAVDRDPLPYLSSSLRYRDGSREHGKPFSVPTPRKWREWLDELEPLPFYRNCFVCGIGRNHPGLKREFRIWNAAEKTVVSPVGFSDADRNSFCRFSKNGFFHPLPFLALLDEILGWGGILLTGCGAVTVDIGFTFYRPVHCGEKLLFFGRGDRLRGRASSRLLFWASGGAAAIRDDGTLETVVSASGQWFAVQDLTRQMRSSLLPRARMERLFELAAPSPTPGS